MPNMGEKEVIGGVSAISSLIQQSFHLLDRVQTALDHNRKHAMHISVVARDIEGAKSIVQQVKTNAMLQDDTIQQTIEAILSLAKNLDTLVTKQEGKTKNGAGFRNFAHSFAKGPKEQKQLEQLRDELMQHKNTLILSIVVHVAPSGTKLDLKHIKIAGAAIMQNGRVMRTAEKKDFDNIVIMDVTMGGSSFMNNSSVTAEQQNEILEMPLLREKVQILLGLVTNAAVPDSIREQILTQIINS